MIGTSEAVIATRSVPPASAAGLGESRPAANIPAKSALGNFRCSIGASPTGLLGPPFFESVANGGPTGKRTPEKRAFIGGAG